MRKVKPSDGIRVLPYIADCVVEEPAWWTNVSVEHQMQTRACYLSDMLDTSSSRLSRAQREQLQNLRMDLIRWSQKHNKVCEELNSIKELSSEFTKDFWREMFDEWYNRGSNSAD